MSAALYKRTVKWKKKKNKRLAKKKKKQEEDEFDEECTFKPKINKTYKLKNETKNVFHDPLWKTLMPKSIIKKIKKVPAKDYKDRKTTKHHHRSRKSIKEKAKIKNCKPRVTFEVGQHNDIEKVNLSRPRTSRQKPTRVDVEPTNNELRKSRKSRKPVQQVGSIACVEEEEGWTMDAAATDSLNSPLVSQFISFSKSESEDQGNDMDFISIDLQKGRPDRLQSYGSEDEISPLDKNSNDIERQNDMNSWQFENSDHFFDNRKKMYSLPTSADRGTPIIDEILSSSFNTVGIDNCMKNNVTFDNQTFYKNTNGHQIVQQLQSFDDNNAFIQEWNATMGGVEFETKDNEIETKRNSQMAKYQNHLSEVKSNTVELHEKNKRRGSESVFILTVHSCQQLKRADAFGKSDPYCIIFQDSYEVGRTPVIKNTLEPQWNFELEIVFEEKNKHPEIILQVFDKDLIGEDNFHGLVYLPPHDVAKYIGEVNVAFTLNPDPHRNARGNAYVGGFMHVSFRQKYANEYKQNELEKKPIKSRETKHMSLDQAWALYSAGHPSFLTHTQMKRLFEYFLDSRISKETLDVFVESMSDETNPRIVSKEAYDNFVQRGKQLSKALDRKKREEFSLRSPHHRILLSFFDKLPDSKQDNLPELKQDKLTDSKKGERKKKKKKKKRKRGETTGHRNVF